MGWNLKAWAEWQLRQTLGKSGSGRCSARCYPFYLPQLPWVTIKEQTGAIKLAVASIEAFLHRFIFGRLKMNSGDSCYQGGGHKSEEIHQKRSWECCIRLYLPLDISRVASICTSLHCSSSNAGTLTEPNNLSGFQILSPPPVFTVLLWCPHINHFEIVVTILEVLFDGNLGYIVWQSLEIMW